eukprot:COSAG01_NODE_2348_length_7857_cov_4.460299_11_plen_167_part_00
MQVKERAGLGPRNTAAGADNAAELSAAVEAAEQEAAAAAAAAAAADEEEKEEEEEEADYGGDSDFEAGESEGGRSAGSDEQQEDEAYQEDDFVRAFIVSDDRQRRERGRTRVHVVGQVGWADSGSAAARSRQDAISAASSGSSVEHGGEVADAAEEDAEVTGRQGR